MPTSKIRATLTGIGLVMPATLTLGYIALNDPHDPAVVMPKCPTKLLTGLDCPACGGLRMTYDVLHGDIAAAAQDNLLLLVVSPSLVLFYMWIIFTKSKAQTRVSARWVGVMTIVVAVIWTIIRNWPGFPLAPVAVNI
ncbi:MAG: DUF2752 domain-containing protein [Mycobacteriaceae bacterium]